MQHLSASRLTAGFAIVLLCFAAAPKTHKLSVPAGGAMRRLIVTFVVILVTASQLTFAQARVDNNIVYGMYSGLGLLMDVYRPSQPNGIGIVAIQGSGYYSPMRYDAPQLKDARGLPRGSEQLRRLRLVDVGQPEPL